MDDLVSIVIPAYNVERYIEATLESVSAQTYENWEAIVVDDRSTDGTSEAVRPFLADARFRYLKNAKRCGAALSRNYALREARGKWIAFLDGDDVWLPEKLEKQLRFMKENGYKFSFTDYRICANGERLPFVNTGPNVVTKRMLRNYCYFSTITAMYDREFVGLIQVADLKKHNDYAMWLEVVKKTPCYRLPLCLSYYMKRDGSLSSGGKIDLIKHLYLLWRRGLKKGAVVSILLVANNLFWGVLKKLRYKEPVAG